MSINIAAYNTPNFLQQLAPKTRSALLSRWEDITDNPANADQHFIQYEIVRLPIAALTANDAQDSSLRETPKKLNDLLYAMLTSRFIAPIVVVKDGNNFHIIDGHRRTAAARIAGCMYVDAIVLERHHITPQVFFAILNSGILKFGGDTWLAGWANCPTAEIRNAFLEGMPVTFRSDTDRLIRLVQNDDIVVKIGKGVRETGVPTPKPNISSVIEKLYLAVHAAHPMSSVTVLDVVRWAISPMRYTDENGDQMLIDNNYTTLSDFFKKAKNLDNAVLRSMAQKFEKAISTNYAIEVLVDEINRSADAKMFHNELPLAKI